MKSFTDVFPTPYGVIFEGGEFVAEFPEAKRDAYMQNKKLNAWLACAKAHDNDYIAFSEYASRLENDLIKECSHTQSLTKTLEGRTKKLDVAIGLLQSVYSIVLRDQEQKNHPVHRLTKQIQELLDSEEW